MLILKEHFLWFFMRSIFSQTQLTFSLTQRIIIYIMHWNLFNAEFNSFQDAVRLSLVYSLQRYAGDEDIKTFVWDLITPKEFGGSKVALGHSGLSAPVPRGRKGKKSKNVGRSSIPDGSSWAQEEKYDAEMFLDKSYRKHLDRHNNKLLLRIRMLFYIHNEILGEYKSQINKHIAAR